MSKLENRDQLIGYLSTLRGYVNRHPKDAEEILIALEAAGCTVVPNEATEEMLNTGVNQLIGLAIWQAMRAASPYRRKP